MARIDDAGFVMIVMTVAVFLFLLHLPQLSPRQVRQNIHAAVPRMMTAEIS